MAARCVASIHPLPTSPFQGEELIPLPEREGVGEGESFSARSSRCNMLPSLILGYPLIFI